MLLLILSFVVYLCCFECVLYGPFKSTENVNSGEYPLAEAGSDLLTKAFEFQNSKNDNPTVMAQIEENLSASLGSSKTESGIGQVELQVDSVSPTLGPGNYWWFLDQLIKGDS